MWGEEVWFHSFLTLAVDGGEWFKFGLGGSQSQSGYFGAQKNNVCPYQDLNLRPFGM